MPGQKKVMTEGNTKPEHIFKENKDITLYTFEKYDVVIVAFTGDFDFIYLPSDTSIVQEVGKKFGYRYMINGSYFELSGEHAGLLLIPGKFHIPVKEDRQLSHIVACPRGTGKLTLIPYQEWRAERVKNVIAFQTGPMVIEHNMLAQTYIEGSINGRGAYKRTLLAFTEEDATKYFLVVKEPVSLIDLGNYLLALSIFHGKTLSVVNLDGGPSVALYSRTHPELNYNVTKRLPILLGIR